MERLVQMQIALCAINSWSTVCDCSACACCKALNLIQIAYLASAGGAFELDPLAVNCQAGRDLPEVVKINHRHIQWSRLDQGGHVPDQVPSHAFGADVLCSGRR